MVVPAAAAAHARQLRQSRRGLGGLGGLVMAPLRPLGNRKGFDDRGCGKREQRRPSELLLLRRELLLLLLAAVFALSRSFFSRPVSLSFSPDEDDLGQLGEPPFAERARGLDVGPAEDAGEAEAV